MMRTHQYQPASSGIATFFRAPMTSCADLPRGSVAVVGVPFDASITLGRRGSNAGPREIRQASCYYASLYLATPDRSTVDLQTGQIVTVRDPLPLHDLGDVDVHPMSVEITTNNVATAVSGIVDADSFPVVLGGDHYVAYPSFKGVADGLMRAGGEARIGYVHIDSHTDLSDELPYAGRYNHATSARRVSEHPSVSTDHMIWLGINGASVSLEQYEYIRDNDLLLISAHALNSEAWLNRVAEALERLQDCTHVYVSIDIDVLDGSAGPGTGATVFEGIGALRYLELVRLLSKLPNLAAIDCCEVAPSFDPSGRTARLAALGIITMLDHHLFDYTSTRPVIE